MTDPSPSPTISVIIPTYDEPERLEAALRSLAVQEYSIESAEIIVVDDASPRFDSAPVYAAAEPFRLKLIRHRTNQGRARARNAGLRAARGEIVVFLDSDMTVEPDFLQVHASTHLQAPGTVVIGNIRFAPGLPRDCLSRYIESRGVHRLVQEGPVPFNCFVTGNASVARELLFQVGLFDEGFTAYGGEDLELGYRLFRRGATFHYAPRALSWHHHLRPLNQLCQLMYSYGRHSLPLLVQKHPELDELLRLDFLTSPTLSFRHLLFRMALSPLLYHSVHVLAQWGLKHYVPGLFFDYLWWWNRTRGYLDAGG